MTRIAVLLPTRGRAQQAAQRVKALRSQPLQRGILLQVVMAIPADDRATLTVARQLSHEPSPVAVLYTVREPGTTAVEGWNRAYELARVHNADWYVLGADDVVWRVGWATQALALADKTGAQVIGLNDGHTDLSRYAPHYMASAAFCEGELGGHIAPPEYQSWWFDREVCERARALGLYAPAWDAHVEHRHPDWRTAPMDDTYREAWPLHDVDRQLYEARRGALV